MRLRSGVVAVVTLLTMAIAPLSVSTAVAADGAIVNGVDVGQAQNDQHLWGDCLVQDFNNGPHGWVIVSTEPPVDPLDMPWPQHIVRNGMLFGWIDAGGAEGSLGCPTSDEYPWGGGARQDFESGSLVWLPGMDHARVEDGPWASQIAATALGEVGVKMESSRWCLLNMSVQSERNGPRIREYLQTAQPDLDWGPLNCTPWCAGFVSWVLKQANPASTVLTIRVSDLHDWAESGRNGLILVPKDQAAPGDIAIYDWQKDGSWDHAGIVVSAVRADGSFDAVDGNTTGSDTSAVVRKTRSTVQYDIVFARPIGATGGTGGTDPVVTGDTPTAPATARGFGIADSYLGGTWARTDPNDGTWYAKGNRPSNGKYWFSNGLGVAADCTRSAATYQVSVSGTMQTWRWWAHVSDGTWVPVATLDSAWSDGDQGLPHC